MVGRKICNFRQLTRYVSKTVQDGCIVFNHHFHTALQTTNRKSYIDDRKILPFLITLSDLRSHSPTASLCKCSFYI